MSDDRELIERLARLEATREGLEAAVKTDARAYLDGQVKSILDNQEANAGDLRRRIKKLRRTLHGRKGDGGVRSELKWLRRWQVVQWAVIAVLVAAASGVKLPAVIP